MPGQIEWPKRKPDPQKHFLLSATEAYTDPVQFRAKINASLSSLPRGQREVVVFVHGFNTRFDDSIYRIAQISNDLDVPGATVSYSWPSAGSPLGYAYDRDSALFSRDDLELLLKELTKTRADNIILVAHSLGSMITMEALRQLNLRKDRSTFNRIGGVVLMSPDIDVDVFRTQVKSIGKLPSPFIVFSSQNDRALQLVERLTGQADRLGRIGNIEDISDFDIVYVDVTAFDGSDRLNHFNAAKSPALLKVLSQVRDFEEAFSSDDSNRAGLLPGTILSVQNASEVILSPLGAR